MEPALAALGEFGLIGLIRRRIQHRTPGTVLGIGDDAAVLAPEGEGEVPGTHALPLEEGAERYGIALVGGDPCASQSGLVLAVTLLGGLARGRALRRSGARPGD